ncbi:unnamed protein product, partial [Mesorhabditis belari]|uniref:G-protein coupled receptors family 1 profile domain-containing protein n=1 Tax=Mesorhabditis belari TaxID=2138241 RepID=A0AAF3FDL9_9BILA
MEIATIVAKNESDRLFSNFSFYSNQTIYINGYVQQERTILELIYYLYMPFCVIIGLTGNCMVWVLIRSNRILSKLPTNMYLLCLAAMSSVFLISLFIFWLDEDIVQTPLFKNTKFSCKIVTFIAHYCDFCSVWLIVLVGFERLILLHRRCRSLSIERAKAQILVLMGTMFICNSWILYVADVRKDTCDIEDGYEYIYDLFTYFEAVFCMALPSFIIIISNVLVVLKLRTHLKRIPSSPTVSFHTGDVMSTSSTAIKSYTRVSRLSTKFSIDADKPKKKEKSLRYTDLQLTRSLLVVTWAFIILNLPNYLYRIITLLWDFENTSQTVKEVLLYSKLCAHMFLYTHHGFLFYLYIFYSPQMKRRLKPTALKLLECYCLKPHGEYSEHT